MPGFNIHLAIGKRYIEKQKNIIKNENSFYNGLVAPDLVTDKKVSHYTAETNTSNLEKYLQGKVRLDLYLKENKVETDFEKGVFLHLFTDYLFFNEFFKKEYIKNITYQDFVRDLYYSYECINPIIIENYKLPMEKYEKRIEENINKMKKVRGIITKEKNNILEIDKLIEFINEVSLINLEEYQQKYKEKEGN